MTIVRSYPSVMVLVADAEDVTTGDLASAEGDAFPIQPGETANAKSIAVTIIKIIHAFFIRILKLLRSGAIKVCLFRFFSINFFKIFLLHVNKITIVTTSGFCRS